jgi:hypothetical protein
MNEQPVREGPCEDCPGRSHPLCCWNWEDRAPRRVQDVVSGGSVDRLWFVLGWVYITFAALVGLGNLVFQPPVPGVFIGLSCLAAATAMAVGLVCAWAGRVKAQPKG